MQAKRILVALVAIISTATTAFGFAVPAGAAAGVTFSGTATAGSTLTVSSPFVQPSTGAGNYIVDTEIYGPSGDRVAQFVETVALGSTSNVRKYSWSTAGLAAGTYRAAQGIFTAGWSANRSWVSNAGSVTIGNATAAASSSTSTAWKLSSTASGSSDVSIGSTFVAPAGFSGTVVLDTEIYGPGGKKVAQWAPAVSVSGGQAVTRNYTWSTAGKPAGTYSVKQGVFAKNWSSKLAWRSDGAKFTVGASPSTTAAPAQAVTTTTTAAPKPVATTTTTTAAPATAVTSWQLGARTSGNESVSVASSFTAPSNFAGSNVVLDTEIYGPGGTKVAQWDETVNLGANQSATRNYTWSTSGKPAGTYTVKQGVFGPNWNGNLAWSSDSAQFSVASGSPTTTAAPAPVQAPAASPAPAPVPSANGAHPFWVDPSNPAAAQARSWESSRPGDAALMKRIADGGAAVWLGGWNTNVQNDTANVVNSAASAGKIPVLVAYNIPNRDCGSYSAGGSSNADAYRTWINGIANGIGEKKAWVVLEPDALSQLDCLDAGSRGARLDMLRNAVATLEAKPNVDVYIDAGHPGWHSASEMANRLRSAGVDRARGFSLNVSNFSTTTDNANYGDAVASLLGNKKYIVDTSRNGNGSNGEWCNPMGRAVGATPTTNTGRANADAYVWIKRPGESDGTCNGGPSAGQWWAEYALGLAQRAWS